MGFIPPLNLGNFQPSPATLSQWIYQIWQYLQENPIATQEQLQEYIGTFITTSPETQAMIGAGVEEYLTENPPTAPVKSVQGKTGAVQLAYNEIVPASNAVPVYKASSTPSTNTLTGQYNLGYRLFVNTATQEIFTISPAGALSLVGRGKFDGTTIDMNTAEGDTTINEAITTVQSDLSDVQSDLSDVQSDLSNVQSGLSGVTNRVSTLEGRYPYIICQTFSTSVTLAANATTTVNIPITEHSGYTAYLVGGWGASTGFLVANPKLTSQTQASVSARNYANSEITNNLAVSIIYIKNA